MVVRANWHGSRVFCPGTRVGRRPRRALPSLLLAMALLEARRLDGLDITPAPQARNRARQHVSHGDVLDGTAEEARLVAAGKEVATRSPPCRHGYKSELLQFSLSGECSIDAFPRSRLREASIVAAVGRATVTGRAIDVLRSMRAGERRVAGAWAHIGMRVRCTPKYEASLGLEQETSIVYVAVRCFLSLSSLLSHLSHLVPPPPTLPPPS